MKRPAVMLMVCVFAVSVIASNAFGWTITTELQNEINQKLKAVELAPNEPAAHFDLAITYAYTNFIQEGWDELKKVNDMDPKFAPIALTVYSGLAAQYPSDWKIAFRLAFALYFNNRKIEAIEVLKKIPDMDPKDDPKRIWAYGYIGLINGELGNVDPAVDYVKKALEIDSNVGALHLLLASGYYKQGRNWEAFWEGVEALRLKAVGY